MKLKRIVSVLLASLLILAMLPMSAAAAKKGIKLDKTKAALSVGETLTLTRTVTGYKKYTVQWSSSDKTVATVSKGKVTAKKEGTATITAKIKGTDYKATCKVTVTKKSSGKADKTSSDTAGKTFKDAKELVSKMKIGWNLGNTLDVPNCDWLKNDLDHETGWGNPKTTKAMIDEVKKAGFNTIRIPVSWGAHMDKNGNINKPWLDRVQEVVDYAYDNGMFIIVNTHHDESWIKFDGTDEAAVTKKFKSVWKQVAARFKDYDERLIFEGLNEPRTPNSAKEWSGGTQTEWDVINRLHKAFISTVRAGGGYNKTRFLMITPYAATSTVYSAMAALEIPDDDRVIVSVHAYSPYNLALNGDMAHKTFDEAGKREIDYVFDNVNKVFISKGIPVIMGECGVTDKGNTKERIKALQYFLKAAKKYDIPCCIWDNGGSGTGGDKFALLNRNTNEWYNREIIKAIMDAVK